MVYSHSHSRSLHIILMTFVLSLLAVQAMAAAPAHSSRELGKRAPDTPIESAGVSCGGGCDDGDACTIDECIESSCQHSPIDCNDSDACNGVEWCDPFSGCLAGKPPLCDDGDACTNDGCDAASGCITEPLSCDDFDSCTEDSCNSAEGCIFTLTDPDWDHVCPSEEDNCSSLYNPEQWDNDKDGVGDACEPFRVNFAPNESETVEGYASDDGSPFVPWRGWGWNVPVPTRERHQEMPQELDTFAFSRDERHWTLQVANGEYDVYVVSGDPLFAQGPHRISAQGKTVVEDVPTARNEYAEGSTRVSVRNGRLDLAVGGTSGNTLINLAEAVRAEEGPSFLRSINFQADKWWPPAGFEPDFGSEFDESRGYGWDGWYESVTQESDLPTVLDSFVRVTDFGTWQIAVPEPGYYEVWLSVGDGLSPAGPHRVVVEGDPVVLSEWTSAGEFLERHTGALVEDGFLTLDVGDEELTVFEEGGGETDINYLVVASASSDADGDEISNEEDLCPFVADEGQDGDKDGQGDACDPDRDNDGAENPADVCPEQWDPFQFDDDLDGLGDACDACLSDAVNDPDDDSVCHLDDNCPDVHNPDQDDFDADGYGDACAVLRINFGPATSPQPEDYRSDHGASFDAFVGRGWSVPVQSRDRHTPAPQELDTFVFTSESRTWRAELPNGDYHVQVSIGDASYPQGAQRVVVQGETVFENHSLSAGQFDLGELDVEVRNGRLELEIGYPLAVTESTPSTAPRSTEGDLTSKTAAFRVPGNQPELDNPFGLVVIGYTTLNWIEAAPWGVPAGIFRSFNFQPAASEAPHGAEVDSGAAFSLESGHGWSAPVQTRERMRPVPQVLDTFAFTSAMRTWEVDVPTGAYRVFVSVGDARYAQGPQRLSIEGALLVGDESTEAGSFIERAVDVWVDDGRLTLEVGGGGGNTCLNWVTIQSLELD